MEERERERERCHSECVLEVYYCLLHPAFTKYKFPGIVRKRLSNIYLLYFTKEIIQYSTFVSIVKTSLFSCNSQKTFTHSSYFHIVFIQHSNSYYPGYCLTSKWEEVLIY